MCYSCAILHCNGCWRRHIYISWTMKNYSVAPQTKDHCVRFVAKESTSAVTCPEWSCTRGARQGIAGSSSGVGRVMLPFPEKIEKWNKRGKTQLQKTKEMLCVDAVGTIFQAISAEDLSGMPRQFHFFLHLSASIAHIGTQDCNYDPSKRPLQIRKALHLNQEML